MKSFFGIILLIILVGSAGFLYRNALEHSSQPIACPLDAKLCPDGTSVTRTGLSCDFPACPPPNVSFPEDGLSFAIPDGFAEASSSSPELIARYQLQPISSTTGATIEVRKYAVDASSTPIQVIHQTAISGTSGAPLNITAFSSVTLGGRQFTTVTIERFEGVIDTAYYLVRPNYVLRFDAIDSGVGNWTASNLDLSKLSGQSAVTKLLANLQVI